MILWPLCVNDVKSLIYTHTFMEQVDFPHQENCKYISLESSNKAVSVILPAKKSFLGFKKIWSMNEKEMVNSKNFDKTYRQVVIKGIRILLFDNTNF